MGFFDWRTQRDAQAPAPALARTQGVIPQNALPKYQGHEIYEWVSVVNDLKRAGDLEAALRVARGCMRAMQASALQDRSNVMEFYVLQVAIIQRRMKDYVAEIATVEEWLSLGLPPTRDDHRHALLKRLAKAKELRARQSGEDPSVHTAEWKRLVAQGKTQGEIASVARPNASSTGRSAATGRSYGYRGTSAPRWVAPAEVLGAPSFIAVDFETANRQRESACQIALVRVDEGRVVDRWATLLAPPPGLDYFQFTYLHGISARDVRSAPTWEQIADRVADFSAGLPMYAHNATFDAGVWAGLDKHFSTVTLPTQFYCSYRTAQRMVPGLVNYKLPTVTAHLVPGYELDHHKADSDAEACALIVAALQRLS